MLEPTEAVWPRPLSLPSLLVLCVSGRFLGPSRYLLKPIRAKFNLHHLPGDSKYGSVLERSPTSGRVHAASPAQVVCLAPSNLRSLEGLGGGEAPETPKDLCALGVDEVCG